MIILYVFFIRFAIRYLSFCDPILYLSIPGFRLSSSLKSGWIANLTLEASLRWMESPRTRRDRRRGRRKWWRQDMTETTENDMSQTPTFTPQITRTDTKVVGEESLVCFAHYFHVWIIVSYMFSQFWWMSVVNDNELMNKSCIIGSYWWRRVSVHLTFCL